MKVYIFDGETKEYLREEGAFAEPLGGKFVLPANGTFVPPDGNIFPGHVQVFNGETQKWDTVPDHRGREIFNVKTLQFDIISQLEELAKELVIVDGEIRQEYADHPEYFGVTPAGPVKKSGEEIEEINRNVLKLRKRRQRDEMFADVDWRMGRVADCKILQIPCPDGRENLVKYRQYLRDFTGQDRWWADGNFIKTLEEFVNLGE